MKSQQWWSSFSSHLHFLSRTNSMLTRRVGQWPVLDYRKCLRRVFLLFLCGQDQLMSCHFVMDNVQSWPTKEKKKEERNFHAQALNSWAVISLFISLLKTAQELLRCAWVCVHSHRPPDSILSLFLLAA